MRYAGLVFICWLFIFSTVLAYAAPVGNITTPKILKKGLVIKGEESQFGLVIGPEVDIIFDHQLKDQEDDTEYKFFGGKAGVIIGDKALVYGLCGAAGAEQKFEILGKKVEWETEIDIAYGAGASLIIYEKEIAVREKGILRIGIDGRYRSSDLDVDKIILNGSGYGSSDASVSKSKFDCSEWQVALEVAYQTDRIIPYGGVKYSGIGGKAEATISGTEYSKDFDLKHEVGIFAGAEVLITDAVSAYAEGRFIDETALSAGAIIRF